MFRSAAFLACTPHVARRSPGHCRRDTCAPGISPHVALLSALVACVRLSDLQEGNEKEGRGHCVVFETSAADAFVGKERDSDEYLDYIFLDVSHFSILKKRSGRVTPRNFNSCVRLSSFWLFRSAISALHFSLAPLRCGCLLFLTGFSASCQKASAETAHLSPPPPPPSLSGGSRSFRVGKHLPAFVCARRLVLVVRNYAPGPLLCDTYSVCYDSDILCYTELLGFRKPRANNSIQTALRQVTVCRRVGGALRLKCLESKLL